MTDPYEFSGTWTMDTAARLQLRIKRIEKAIANSDLTGAVVEAEELLDEAPEHTVALSLLANCLLELGDAVGALQVYNHIRGLNIQSHELLLRAATAAYEACELKQCLEISSQVINQHSDCGEGHYYIGMCLERMPGRTAESASAFTAAFYLDSEAFPLPLQVLDNEWESLIEQALMQSAGNIREFWSGIPMLIEEFPTLEEARNATPPIPPNVLGLYVGSPPESDDPWINRPDGLRFFRKSLLRCMDKVELVESISSVLEEEAAGWLGLPLDTQPFPHSK